MAEIIPTVKAIKTRMLLLIAFILTAYQTARPQQFFFTSYPIEKGLSQSVVNCVFQDSRGYIWVGTQNGLNRFDGYHFEIYSYDPADSCSLSNSWIYSIDEDREGDLWVGTKGGLNHWIRKEKRFRRMKYSTGYANDVTDYPYDARVARNGSLLINTPPVLSIYDPARKVYKHYTSSLPYDGSVKDNRMPLLEDREGMIWIGSTKGLACFNPRTEKFSYFTHQPGNPNSISDNTITALYEADDGAIWIGTTSGLNRFDRKIRTFKKYYSNAYDNHSLSNNFIRAITGDAYGALWIGTEGGGLNRAMRSPDGKLLMESFTSENHGPGHNIILALMVDKSRNLWIGTLQGLSKTDLKPRKFHLYRRDDTPYSTNLLGNVIASIHKDDKGLIWVGNWGQGLNVIDRKTGQVSYFSTRLWAEQHIPNDFVHVIFADSRNNIWIGTRDGICVYDRTSSSFIRFREFFRNNSLPDFLGVRIYAIIRGRDNSYWIGTQSGLYRVNLTTSSTEIFRVEASGDHCLSGNLVYSLMEDRDGLIWIATLSGLDVFNPKTGIMKHFKKNDSPNSLCDNFVISLCEDHHGDIWIGTGSYVNRFVKHDSAFIYYSQENGLPNNRIFEILQDQRRNLWFATGGGLCRLDTATGRFRTYSVEEGLQSMEFNLRACCKSSDGEMFFGGMNGFNSFYPDSLRDNPFIPEIVFTSFYKTTQAEKEYLDVENTGEVILNYNDHTFTIEFAALEFTNPEKNRYAYMLEGVSSDWIETGNRRFVPFSNLPPGEYTFRVKGSNNDGLWNMSGPSLKIIIKPPWWQSSWAWTAYLILLTGIIMLYVRMRERKLLHERDLLEQKVHLRTLQIEEQNAQILQKNEELSKLNNALSALNATRDKFFSIIAHDLRNPFNTILGLSEMALGNIVFPEHDKIRKSVTDIRDTAKHTFDLLQNLLLWARTQTGALDFLPVSFDLSERITENIDLVTSQAAGKNIEISYANPLPILVTGDMRMIDTVLRNLLTNAIKFTHPHGRVFVSVQEMDTCIEVMVQDTGIGIAHENISRIFMLDNKYTRKGTEKERGSGLGLILCREFVEKHNGTILVESEPGNGSRFIFTLPK
jgi:signal transduction histidine kinase/ligand-binding sensor domain-containing protein